MDNERKLAWKYHGKRQRLRGSVPICSYCVSFLHDLVSLNLQDWDYLSGKFAFPTWAFHLGTLCDALRSAQSGCVVCAEFCAAWRRSLWWEPHDADPEDVGLSVHAHPAKLRSHETPAQFAVHTYAFSSDKFASLDFELFHSRPSLVPTYLVPEFDMPWPVATTAQENQVPMLALKWMEDCHAGHAECSKLRRYPLPDTPLPTRVLQILDTGHSDPILLVSKGKKDKYATLSHCWGTSKRLTLTKENIGALQQRVPFDELPATFRHAIWFVRQLHIKYLWIDCYGIMQNSRDDWLKESAKMSDIYSNAAISLCAASAEDSNQGLFNERPRRGVEVTIPDYGLIGVRPLLRDHALALFSAPVQRRAWILQETALAPAVLYLAQDALYWQCYQRNASETWPAFAPSKPQDIYEQIPTHINFSDESLLDSTPYLTWYRFMREYTWRHLTNPTDRLIAISGLAQRFSSLTRTAWAYGLPMNDLHRGLLWHRGMSRGLNITQGEEFETDVDYLSDTTKFPEKNAPSWSWGSLIGGLTYDWGELPMPFEHETKWKYRAEVELSRNDQEGALRLKGCLLRGRCQLVKTDFDDVGHVIFQPIGQESQTSSLGCVIDFSDEYSTPECFLLPISAWSAKYNDAQHAIDVGFYLLLVKVRSSTFAKSTDAEKDEPSAFRRIGMGGCRLATFDVLLDSVFEGTCPEHRMLQNLLIV